MANKTAPLLPSTGDLLHQFGDQLRLARRRRRLSAKQVAERAGMSPTTLRSLERGASGVTVGAYLSVMQVLGIEKDMELLAKADPLGRELQDAQLSAFAPISTAVISEKLRKSIESLTKSQTDQIAAIATSFEPSRKAFESLNKLTAGLTAVTVPCEQLRKSIESLTKSQTEQIASMASSFKPIFKAIESLRRSIAGLTSATVPSEQLRKSIESLTKSQTDQFAVIASSFEPSRKVIESLNQLTAGLPAATVPTKQLHKPIESLSTSLKHQIAAVASSFKPIFIDIDFLNKTMAGLTAATVPSEQLRKSIESLSKSQMDQIASIVSSFETMRAWTQKNSFTNSETLAKLINSKPRPPKTRF